MRNLRQPASALLLDYNGVLWRDDAIDPDVLAFVREVRAAGRPVALCSNTSDDLRATLGAAGVADEFDAVIASNEVGWSKPSKPFFDAACAAVDAEPQRCLLVDDTDRNIRGARAAGLAAIRFTAVEDLAYARRALALPM